MTYSDRHPGSATAATQIPDGVAGGSASPPRSADRRRHSSDGHDAERLGIEAVTRMVAYRGAMTSASGPELIAVSLPRIRFLEGRP